MHNHAMLAAFLIVTVSTSPETHTSATPAQSGGASTAAQQATPRPDLEAPPGGMTLLPGYKHGRERGMDTKRGRIWKEGGLTITYDIGDNAGDKARSVAKRPGAPGAWSLSSTNLRGDSIIITMNEAAQYLVVSVGGWANFETYSVRDKKDMAEMLSMVMTYDLRTDLGLK